MGRTKVGWVCDWIRSFRAPPCSGDGSAMVIKAAESRPTKALVLKENQHIETFSAGIRTEASPVLGSALTGEGEREGVGDREDSAEPKPDAVLRDGDGCLASGKFDIEGIGEMDRWR